MAGLWLVGVALAVFTAPRAWRRTGVDGAFPFILAAVGLAALAYTVLRAKPVSLIVSTALLGAQLFGVIGSAVQLLNGVSGSKTAELHRLGIDPEVGVALNLLYSTAASAVFAWVAIRWRNTRRL